MMSLENLDNTNNKAEKDLIKMLEIWHDIACGTLGCGL